MSSFKQSRKFAEGDVGVVLLESLLFDEAALVVDVVAVGVVVLGVEVYLSPTSSIFSYTKDGD